MAARVVGSGMRVGPRSRRDVFAPSARHSYYVTEPGDVAGVPGWDRDVVYAAVRTADGIDDGCVVVAYDRHALYVATQSAVTYHPPGLLGVRRSPRLAVADAHEYRPDSAETVGVGAVTVEDTFDVLVPAFDWTTLTDDDVPPAVPRRRTHAPSETGAGTRT
ncbi:hypothetical protein VNG_0105H [Halobacterium salinarum NRC-1]|uniref:Uncharacterized protein n=3 Tax=Halobacterium TaxID=2239 RepID=Q9HSS0_HALSA|nr:hypothetical protein VNG_0105H [Halobacterium salinarum NRC-1]CAP12983.1 uncharacterized protein OE_1168R [Halobacterium salinarum R1]DAC77417.1 TPA_inf: uncharacterized protein VNG_0105H [Halobacterium salinarum NRC-1]